MCAHWRHYSMLYHRDPKLVLLRCWTPILRRTRSIIDQQVDGRTQACLYRKICRFLDLVHGAAVSSHKTQRRPDGAAGSHRYICYRRRECRYRHTANLSLLLPLRQTLSLVVRESMIEVKKSAHQGDCLPIVVQSYIGLVLRRQRRVAHELV